MIGYILAGVGGYNMAPDNGYFGLNRGWLRDQEMAFDQDLSARV